MALSLNNSTGNQKADKVLQGVVRLFEAVFPDRVRGYYVYGSYADQTEISASDLDMQIVFKGAFHDDTEKDKAQQICEACGSMSSIGLDAVVRDEQSLFRQGSVNFKLASLFIYGQDIREKIPLPPMEEYARKTIEYPTYLFARARQGQRILRFPLDYPDPRGKFFGYDYRKIRQSDGSERNSTKGIINVTGRIATAKVILRNKEYVPSKRHGVELYRKSVNDDWIAFLEEIDEKCRQKWGYLIPQDEQARRQLKELCRRTLQFENHYFSIYNRYLLNEIRHPSSAKKIRCLQSLTSKRINCSFYPDPAVCEAVRALEQFNDPEVRDLATQTLVRIKELDERNQHGP